MAEITPTEVAAPVVPVSIPVRELLPWALFALVIGLLMLYFVGAEQGATSLIGGTAVHEFVHDGRHLLGFPLPLSEGPQVQTRSVARRLLVRGMLAGLAAGVVAFVVARLVGESQVSVAIAVESAHDRATGMSADPEVFSRAVQRGIGLLTATTLYGVGLGGIFALVFAATLGRLGRFGARSLAGLLALGAFVTMSVVPFVKYPPNPPAIGNPDTIGRRTALYFTMLAVSILLGVLAVMLGRRLAPRLGGWNATIAAGLAFLLLVVICQWVLPPINEVGADFPAVTLFRFRMASLAIQASVWTTLGLLFGALADQVLPSAEAIKEFVPAPAAR